MFNWLFNWTLYESEHTKFMRTWMEQHPEELAEQKAGREMWWDKQQDESTIRNNAESRVPQKAYYYDTNF